MTDRNDPPEGMNSDELIRRAREASGGDSSIPEPDSPPSQEIDSDVPQTSYQPPGYEAPTYEPPPPAASPSDYVRPDYTEDSGGSLGGGVTYEAQKQPFIRRYGGLLLVVIAVAGLAIFSTLDKTKSTDSLAAGDCLLYPDADEFKSIESIDCSEPHDVEVIGVVTIPGERGAPYPGEFSLGEQIVERCIPLFEQYVGLSYEASKKWYPDAFYPTEESWTKGNQREGTCLVFQLNEAGEPTQVSYSARNSGE